MPTNRPVLPTVVQWRREQLLQAGLPRRLAQRVAQDERYDLHELIRLLEHGCAPAVAVRILRPIEPDKAA
jgi:hypothetical protein